MTALPKKKQSRSRSNKRKNALSNRLSLPALQICPSCKKLKEPHKTCPYCGAYKQN